MPRRSRNYGELRCRCTSIANMARFTTPIPSWAGSIRLPALDRRQPSRDGHGDNDQDAGGGDPLASYESL
jgi:hypothetical protein